MQFYSLLFRGKVFDYQSLVCLLIRWFLLFFFSFVVSGCAGYQSQAPIQPKKRDLTNSSYYKVKKGDTLYSVGFRSGHGYERLALWNNIVSPYELYVGQTLKLSKGNSINVGANSKKIKSKRTNISTSNKKVLKLNWQWPVTGKVVRNFYNTDSKGIDISGRVGQQIKAAESGVVAYSGSGLLGYGKLLIIKHNYLYLSAYAHNRRLLVKEGQKVKKGQLIAEMGVGVNGKPALHFEIRKNGKPVNPLIFLSK
ncbi:MAG: peptidoglycan DD-metalloendopeptidase family protein [Methyloprofundus sp.]|nr:peptidoglycan DD-metalloendopeptidase family protein [Methyloprofundus sp.]